VKVEGGSFGLQAGGSATDVVMLVMNEKGMNELEKSKFTLGGDASVAAGPVGRSATANTDAYMTAEILSWSRSKGVFAGLALDGASLRPDREANQELYNEKLDNKQILMTSMAPPASARPLIAELDRYSPRK
jgi:lipid-binding SYLF domain-containing protein